VEKEKGHFRILQRQSQDEEKEEDNEDTRRKLLRREEQGENRNASATTAAALSAEDDDIDSGTRHRISQPVFLPAETDVAANETSISGILENDEQFNQTTNRTVLYLPANVTAGQFITETTNKSSYATNRI
jgi:hypothetical protein